MSRRIQLVAHLSTAELHVRYRNSTDRVERARYQALWLLSQGMPREEVSRTMGYGPEWVRRVAARYNTSGEASVADGRHRNRGHAPLLNPAQMQALEAALERPAAEGIPWSGPQAARWMSERLGRPVAPQRGWDYLRRSGHTLQRPRPQHQASSPEAQASFPAGAAADP